MAELRIPKPSVHCPECGGPFDYERNPYFSEEAAQKLPLGVASVGYWRALPHPTCQAASDARERLAIESKKAQELDLVLKGSGFPGDIRLKRLETFQPSPENQGSLELVRRWRTIDRFGFWISGPAGSGKSHLMGSFVNRYIADAKKSVPNMVWWSVPFLFDRIAKDVAKRDDTEPTFNGALRADVLFLDDLGAQQGKPWETERLFQIFDFRLSSKLPTFITTNLSAQEIKTLLHERVLSRLVGLCVPVELKGKDGRSELLANRIRMLSARKPD